MICKPYSAIIPASTCVARQHIIETQGDKKTDWHNIGPETIIHRECKSCSKGKALYARAKATGNLPDVKFRRRVRQSRAELDIIAYQARNVCVGW